VLNLVEDWRPVPTARLTEPEVEEIKSRWRETYRKPGTAQPLIVLNEEQQP
jgi:hypothetical protein